MDGPPYEFHWEGQILPGESLAEARARLQREVAIAIEEWVEACIADAQAKGVEIKQDPDEEP